MLDELLAALAAKEEKVVVGGRTLVVRELDCAAEVPESGGKVLDFSLQLIVLCTFDEAGNRVFSDEALPRLKKSGRKQMAPLINAALRVNGLNVEAEAKNSEAAPAGG